MLNLPRISTIHYASVFPGTGKTHWAIKALARRILANKGTTIYVGPTLLLLKEVRASLQKRLPVDKHKFIHLVESGRSYDVTSRQVRLLVAGGTDAFGTKRNAEPEGTVILCSHETFSRLPHNYDEGMPVFIGRSKVSVIFDEARKCTVREQSLTIPHKVAQIILREYLMFDPYRENDGTYQPVHVRNRDTKSLDQIMSQNKLGTKLRGAVVDLIVAATNSAVQVYVTMKEQPDSDDKTQTNIVFQVIRVPHLLFSGWKHVILLSAFFESSQMYHLLKRRAAHLGQREQETAVAYRRRIGNYVPEDNMVKLVDITDSIVDARRVKEVYARYKSASVTYISPNVPYSKSHLERGVMVDSIALETFDLNAFSKKYKELISEKRVKDAAQRKMPIRGVLNMMRLAKNASAELSDHEREIIEHVKTLPGLSTKYTPLQWAATCAVKLSTAWYKKHGKEPAKLPITCNVGRGEFSLEVAAILPDEVWRQMPLYSQGLNKFRTSDTIAFLASLNPTPQAKKFLNEICPKYDTGLDYTLDQCVQSATRCSIRDTKSNSKPLIIVTDKPLAERVIQHLNNLPTLVDPTTLGLKLKDPVSVITDDNVGSRVKAHRAKPATKDREKFIRVHSQYLKKKTSLQVWISRNKAMKGQEQYEDKAKELKAINEKFSIERAILIKQYQAEKEIDITKPVNKEEAAKPKGKGKKK